MANDVIQGAEPTYAPGDAAGVLMLHDLGSSPQLFHSMADALQAADMAVDVPLLPGHGTSIEELKITTWDDWASAAQLALDELAARSGPIVVVGTAMGAALGAYVMLNHPSVVGFVAINPRALPVPQGATDMLKAMMADGAETLLPLGPDVSNHAEVLSYKTVPVATLISMFEALSDMEDHWDEVNVPTLLVTSARDHRVSPYNAEWLGTRISGPVERVTLENSFHEATVDVEHELLEKHILDFVHQTAAASRA